MNQRRSYTPEFKEEAVRLAMERGFSQAARDLGINVSLIRRWKNHLDEDGERPFPGKGNPRDEEMARLQREPWAPGGGEHRLKKGHRYS